MLLNTLRDGKGAAIVKFTALGFVMLGVCGMIFMDVGGVFGRGLSDTTLARVGSTKISLQAFERTATPTLHAQNMTLEEAYRFGLLQNILDDMIARELLRQETTREGLVIGREDIAAKVHDLVKEQVQPGETPQQTLERLLSARGLTQEGLVASIRQEIGSTLIQAPLRASTAFVPKLATQALERFEGERRDISFFMLTPESAGANIKADDESLKSYYETVRDQFQIPEQRRFRALVLDADAVRAGIAITDADVKAAYEERRDQFKTGERRRIEQAVFQDESAAKTAVENLRKNKKASLRKIAGKDAYRDPAEVEQTTLPGELASAVFTADKGALLNPIQTPLGWHVIRVIDVIPARIQPLAAVQADLRKELESDAVHAEMDSRVSKVDEALGQGDSIDQIAQALNLPIATLGPVDAQGTIDPAGKTDPVLSALAQNRDLLSSLFELMEGETSDLSEVNESTYAVFALQSVTPSRDRDLAEVRAQVEKKWLDDQRRHALDDAVARVMDDVTRQGKDFAQAAKDAGAVLKTARDVGRNSTVAGLNDPVALNRLFDETDLSAVVKVPTEKGVILAKVLDARIPDTNARTSSPKSADQWRTRMEQATASLFLSDLRRDGRVTINTELLEQTYGGHDADDRP